MRVVTDTLRAFAGAPTLHGHVNESLMSKLGGPTDAKRWLARSLEKTIRLQLDPPADLRAMCALTGPDRIGEGP